jgi:hypothetical protein
MTLNFAPYQHHFNPDIEIMANKNAWEEVKHLMVMEVTTTNLMEDLKSKTKLKIASIVAYDVADS